MDGRLVRDLGDHRVEAVFDIGAVDLLGGDFPPVPGLPAHQPDGTHTQIETPKMRHAHQIARNML